MPQLFDPTPDALAELERLADEIPEIQQILVDNHEKLKRNDRGAHQQQIAGGKVTLTVADQLPSALDGLGLFEPGVTHVGIGRMSTGLGCPHIETDLDFLGIMLAFRTSEGQRVDFLGHQRSDITYRHGRGVRGAASGHRRLGRSGSAFGR